MAEIMPMSSLQRYKKSGGFVQLLVLLESFGPQKKEKFLEVIEAESSVWARALRDKMLTLERMLKWPDEVLAEVLKRLPAKTAAFVISGLPEDQRPRFTHFYSAADQRRMDEIVVDAKAKPEEVSSTMFKLVEEARRMLIERQLVADKIDQALVIPENYESQLESQSSLATAAAGLPDESVVLSEIKAEGAQSQAAAPHGEVVQLQKALSHAIKENRTLKEENRLLRDKLEQIRKIA